MIGQKDFAPKLFQSVRLEDLVPKDHELRRVLGLIDFSVMRMSVMDKYSHTGQPGVDPEVIIKILFLGYYYGISSERKLAKDIIINTAYRWFLGYDLDEATPTHSVLSKARSRFGLEVFQSLFDRIVSQCIKAGLVGGKKAFIDASLIEADASEESLVARIKVMSPREYTSHMMKEEEPEDEIKEDDGSTQENKNEETKKALKLNDRLVSTTDPDASFTSYGKKAGLNYEGHYLVDEKNKVIVGVSTTNTVNNASYQAPDLLQKALFRHRLKYRSLCADTEYSAQNFYHYLQGQNITPYIPEAQLSHRDRGFFIKEEFSYDREKDRYRCPGNQELRPVRIDRPRQRIDYRTTRKNCEECRLKTQCTESRLGRVIKRLFYEDSVQWAKGFRKTEEYEKQIKLRRVIVEPLFAEAKQNHGMGRAKYRRKWRVSIQVLWTATVQNIKRLLKAVTRPPRKAVTIWADRMDEYLLQYFYFYKKLLFLNDQRVF